jgi:hypothetical protein
MQKTKQNTLTQKKNTQTHIKRHIALQENSVTIYLLINNSK